jgi:hypothetical protein
MTSSYLDPDGIRHDVAVRRAVSGDWQVLDTSPAETRVVETLSCHQDGQDQADAVAYDYTENVHRLGWISGCAAAEPIPERGGTDAHSDRRPHGEARQQPARGAALSRPGA